MEATGFYKLCCELDIVPRIGVRGGRMLRQQFNVDLWNRWNEVFDIHKINRMGKRKPFHFMIHTNGVGVSLLYDVKKEDIAPMAPEEIKRKYRAGEFVNELGIDPGMKTWNATVRRNIRTGKEVSISVKNDMLFRM